MDYVYTGMIVEYHSVRLINTILISINQNPSDYS